MAKTQKTTKKQAAKEQSTDDAVETVVGMFNDSWNFAKDNYHGDWDNYRDLYNNIRVKMNYMGTADVFVPMTFSTIETIVAGLLSDRPRFDFSLAATSIDPEELLGLKDNPEELQKLFTSGIPINEEDIKILNELVDTYWEDDYWDSKIALWVKSMLIYGTSMLFLSWDMDKPSLINVPIFDAIIDPTATNPQDAKYYGRRYLTTVDELESHEIVNPETKEMDKRYKNLDQIPMGKAIPKELDKYRKEMFGSSTLGGKAADRQVEVIEIWTQDKLYSVANRSICIEDTENPTLTRAKQLKRDEPKGIMPFAPLRNYPMESLFYGKSEIAPILDSQEMLNDMTNQGLDAASLRNNPMWHLDPKFADRAGEITAGPGIVFPFASGALTPVPLPNIASGDLMSERMNIKNEIRETTASDQIIKGVGGGGDKTATEINTQVQQSGMRFSTKIRELEVDGFKHLSKILLEFMGLYIDKPILVRRSSGQEGRVSILDPEIFTKDIKVGVQLEASAQAQRNNSQNGATNTYLMLRDDPSIDQVELKRILLPKTAPEIDKQDIDKLVITPETQGPTIDQSTVPNEMMI